MKLLLTDDDALLRDMYAKKFTELGHDVVVAEDAEAGLECIKSHGDFDAVVFDMIMPKLDGVGFVEKARTLPEAEQTRFIVLTNQSEDADQQRAREAGVDGYIIKAETVPSEVVTTVAEIIKDNT